MERYCLRPVHLPATIALRMERAVSELSETIPLIAEELTVGKRVTAHTVDISTVVEERDEVVSTTVRRARVEVRHVAINREVAEVPRTRTENDVVIVPVYEERVKLVKQIFLVEELHVHEVQDKEHIEQPIKLRSMRAIVEHRHD